MPNSLKTVFVLRGLFWAKNPNLNLKDTLLRVETAAGVFTKIHVIRWLGQGRNIETMDSIKCKPNVENVFEITF
jgi:hypothetical protein